MTGKYEEFECEVFNEQSEKHILECKELEKLKNDNAESPEYNTFSMEA